MKKMPQFFVVMISMLIIHTESNATNNATKAILSGKSALYVKWTTVPSAPTQTSVVSWLKTAMQGKSISGATVNANRNSYEKVWGAQLYNEVLTASESDFTIVKSDGSEKNYGVDGDGNPVPAGTLNAGLPLIAYKGYPIAKWGSNACINAISAFKKSFNPETDPDAKREGDGRPGNFIPVGGGGSSVVIMTGGGQTIPAMTYEQGRLAQMDGIGMYERGANFGASTVLTTMDHTALMLIASKSNNNNCGGCGSASSVSTVSAAPVQNFFYPTAAPSGNISNNNQSFPSEITVRNKPNVLDYLNTGANLWNATMNGINTFRGYRIEDNRTQTNYGYNNTWSGGNNGGYTNNGQIRFEGPSNTRTGYGQSSNGGYINYGNNNNGSYGNTWNNGSSY